MMHMKKILIFVIALLLFMSLFGCQGNTTDYQIATTTLPVYDFTAWLCQDTDITVTRLITENVTCLHDYTLQVAQMRAIEASDAVVVSGADLEGFLDDALVGKPMIDASKNISLFSGNETHIHEDGHGHDHDHDPHIWLSPANAKQMAQNISIGLIQTYPQYSAVFENNLATLLEKLDALDSFGKTTLKNLSCYNLITFHDGFAYFADSYGLTILHAVEEESGSEASASELIEIINTVNKYDLPAIFTETNGSGSAASIISSETGVDVYVLDMAMAGDSYFEAMYRNINTIKEALG